MEEDFWMEMCVLPHLRPQICGLPLLSNRFQPEKWTGFLNTPNSPTQTRMTLNERSAFVSVQPFVRYNSASAVSSPETPSLTSPIIAIPPSVSRQQPCTAPTAYRLSITPPSQSIYYPTLSSFPLIALSTNDPKKSRKP